MQKLQQIAFKDVWIEILSEQHKLNSFSSYEGELVKFLQEDALHNQKKKLSVTFLWFYENSLAGYITLLNDSIRLEGYLKTAFKRKGIYYKALPALKIGRLCVDDNFLRRGLGRLMVRFAIDIAVKMNSNMSGCRFLTLDAKMSQNYDPVHFYKKLNFQILKENTKRTIPMFLDLERFSQQISSARTPQ